MIYEDFVRTLLARMGLPYEKADAGAARDGVDRLVRLSAMVDDLLAEAGYDTMFDTREKCLEALRQDIKAKLSATITADDDIKTRQLFARILLYERDKLLTWDEIRAKLCEKIGDFGVVIERYKGALKTSAQEVSRAESNLRDEIALRVKLATENAKLRADAEAKLGTAPVDQEGLAKAIYDPNGAKAWPWELVGPETKADYLAKADAALKYIGATSTANETLARNLLTDEVLRLRTELADAQRQVGVWRDSVETQKKMRLDLAVEQDKLVAALDEAQNQLAAERKKWPELKAEVERLKRLVRTHELTIALFEKIILGHADPGAVLRDAETGETAHIAPDVRVALKKQRADIEQMARTNFDLRKELGDVQADDREFRFKIANGLLGLHRTSAPAWDELLVKLEERLKELTNMSLSGVPEYVALAAAKKPLDRDRVRLALLDFEFYGGDQFVQNTVNALADHLVKRLA